MMPQRTAPASGETAGSSAVEDLAILRRLHAETFDEREVEILQLKGDASDRRIFRLRGNGNTSIGIIGPNRDENRAFIGFARSFRAHGLRVPQIYAVDPGERCYLEEDLGDVTLSEWTQRLRAEEDASAGGAVSAGEPDSEGASPAAGEDASTAGVDASTAGEDAPAGGEASAAGNADAQIAGMYGRVLEELPRFQVDAADNLDYGLCYQYEEFGREAMEFDIRYFRTMFLEPLVRVEWDPVAFARECDELIVQLLTADRSHFLYRDFQSRNIMIRDGDPWFIDFQSGRRGALHYDVASLLFDSRGGLDNAMRTHLLDRYLDALGTRMDVDRAHFIRLFEGFAILRLMQALGAFGNAGLNRDRPEYLELIPSRLSTLAALARRAEVMDALPSLRALFTAAAEEGGTVSPTN